MLHIRWRPGTPCDDRPRSFGEYLDLANAFQRSGDQMIAELLHLMQVEQDIQELQCCRDQSIAEMRTADTVVSLTVGLQWGHDHPIVEIS